MTAFTRLHVALALAALSLYASLLSAELEDAFRLSEPAVRHTVDWGQALGESASAGMVVIARQRPVVDTVCSPAKWGFEPTAFPLRHLYTAPYERGPGYGIPLRGEQGMRSAHLGILTRHGAIPVSAGGPA